MTRIPVNKPYSTAQSIPFGDPDPKAFFKRHSGIDYAVPLNRPIYATVSGQLTNVVSATGGNMVRIFDGKYYHRLMHNNSFSRSNGPVNEGDEVAKAGTTGISNGVHSHWDVATQAVPTNFNQFINPATLLNQGGIVMSPEQIQDWISKEHFIGYGFPASDATFKNWGDLLRNNPIDGALTILTAIDRDPNSLKNISGVGFTKLPFDVYKKN